MLNYFKTLTWEKLNKLLLILILTYIILVFGLCCFKYFTFSYNALDLAIYNQVFYNSALGHFFNFTIHPTSYLGDHLELLILLLVPFYSLFKSPLTLLFLQTIFLAGAAIPLFLLAKKFLQPSQILLVLIFYLFNPVAWNINLYEFHLLAFAPFFLCWAFYFYKADKFWFFIIFALLILTIREDLSFVIFMFGIIALIDKKKIQWIITPIILATLYFFTALKITAYFSSSGQYKFLGYYKWLGNNPWEILVNFFAKFPLVLDHVLTLANFEFILGFFLVFLFIPLFRPKYLLLALGTFVQLLLGPAGGELILRMHYGAVFLIVFSWALIFSFHGLAKSPKAKNFYANFKDIIIIVLAVGLIYNFLVIGPAVFFIKQVFQIDYQQIALKNQFINELPADAAVIAPYSLLPNLSSRSQVYGLNYVFLGQQQYGAGLYPIPDNIENLLIDFNDFLTYHVQYSEDIKDYYYQGDNNLRKLLTEKNFKLKKASNTLALYQKDYQGQKLALYKILDKKPELVQAQVQIINNQLEFLGSQKKDNQLILYFQASEPISTNYFLQADNQLYPLGFGLYPTTEWQKDQIIALTFYDLPTVGQMSVLNFSGQLKLNGLGSTYEDLKKKEILGQFKL
ncbi:MAG: hypothetical protein A2Y82_00915 [Candidatus Buchananbacteria bacterium RBG_13_36_9]|uniref:DUF2079 domain-containing protein n=1 Tax=Candidatus Buchananbacteria bacterium RBG_13_36_9 TaxID=1797530 RepID=A0A1G1XN63_9BACT|nr:MAG: hypothetical protein A2Y82_00915 [Candidatus Buchananbacteria bacterium RBG_13_36_9]